MEFKIQNSSLRQGFAGQAFKIDDLIKVLLENRGVRTEKEIEEFLNPKLGNVSVESVGIDKKQLKKAIERVKKAIGDKEQIVIFGDYDVDGICGSAILWEVLNSLEARVMPYIPHRVEEGYGLSIKGISNVRSQILNVKLIITVDNGIVANKAVEFANKEGIDVIITDHHVLSKNPPNAFAIIHTTKLCGTGVAYLLAQEISNLKSQTSNKLQVQNSNFEKRSHLELVALATVADLVPLIKANRALLRYGLKELQKTERIGLLEIFKESGIDKNKIGVYEIGHIIAPRLNAMGRLEYAMDSLRLLCTRNKERAKMLAETLGRTNRERQEVTIQTAEHAILSIKNQKSKTKNLLFISNEKYQQGVIGLVAGKLVEEFYRPSVVVSVGKKYAKASARSIKGFNIIEFIRTASEILVDAGGHPMAAGFTVETSKLTVLKQVLEAKAEELLTGKHFRRTLNIDCELDLSYVNKELYSVLQKLSPFGMGNPEPVFLSKNVSIEDVRLVGNGGKHLKLKFRIQNSEFRIDGIAFGMGELYQKLHVGETVDIAYIIDENRWNGNSNLQLKVRDIKLSKT